MGASGRWTGNAGSVSGVPGRAVPLGVLAQRANPLRGAVKPGTEPGLEATAYFGPEMGATASGVHAMIVEMDAETLRPTILRKLRRYGTATTMC